MTKRYMRAHLFSIIRHVFIDVIYDLFQKQSLRLSPAILSDAPLFRVPRAARHHACAHGLRLQPARGDAFLQR